MNVRLATLSEVDFKFDRQAIERLTQGLNHEAAQNIERDLNRLSSQLKGRPPENVKGAVQRLFASHGGKVTEPDLSTYAEAVSEGQRIVVRVS